MFNEMIYMATGLSMPAMLRYQFSTRRYGTYAALRIDFDRILMGNVTDYKRRDIDNTIESNPSHLASRAGCLYFKRKLKRDAPSFTQRAYFHHWRLIL